MADLCGSCNRSVGEYICLKCEGVVCRSCTGGHNIPGHVLMLMEDCFTKMSRGLAEAIATQASLQLYLVEEEENARGLEEELKEVQGKMEGKGRVDGRVEKETGEISRLMRALSGRYDELEKLRLRSQKAIQLMKRKVREHQGTDLRRVPEEMKKYGEILRSLPGRPEVDVGLVASSRKALHESEDILMEIERGSIVDALSEFLGEKGRELSRASQVQSLDIARHVEQRQRLLTEIGELGSSRDKELAKSRSEKQSAREQLSSLNEQCSRTKTSMNQKVEEAQRRIEARNTEEAKAQGEVNALKAEAGRIGEERKGLTKACSELREKGKVLQQENLKFEKTLNSNKEENKRLQQEHARLEREVNEERRKKERLVEENLHLEREKEYLREKRGEIEKSVGESKDKFDSVASKIEGLKAEKLSLIESDERLKKQQSAKSAVLSKYKAAKACSVELNKRIKELQTVESRQSIQVAKRNEDLRYNYEKLRGAYVELQCSYQTEERNYRLMQEKAGRRIQHQIENIRGKDSRIDELNQNITDLNYCKRSLKSEKTELRAKNQRLQRDQEEMKKELERLKNVIGEKNWEALRLEAKIAELQRGLSEMQCTARQCSETMNSWLGVLNDEGEKLDQKAQTFKYKEYDSFLTSHRSTLAQFRTTLRQLIRDWTQNKERIARQREEAETLSLQCNQRGMQLEDLEAECRAGREKREKLDRQIAEKQKELNEIAQNIEKRSAANGSSEGLWRVHFVRKGGYPTGTERAREGGEKDQRLASHSESHHWGESEESKTGRTKSSAPASEARGQSEEVKESAKPPRKVGDKCVGELELGVREQPKRLLYELAAKVLLAAQYRRDPQTYSPTSGPNLPSSSHTSQLAQRVIERYKELCEAEHRPSDKTEDELRAVSGWTVEEAFEFIDSASNLVAMEILKKCSRVNDQIAGESRGGGMEERSEGFEGGSDKDFVHIEGFKEMHEKIEKLTRDNEEVMQKFTTLTQLLEEEKAKRERELEEAKKDMQSAHSESENADKILARPRAHYSDSNEKLCKLLEIYEELANKLHTLSGSSAEQKATLQQAHVLLQRQSESKNNLSAVVVFNESKVYAPREEKKAIELKDPEFKSKLLRLIADLRHVIELNADAEVLKGKAQAIKEITFNTFKALYEDLFQSRINAITLSINNKQSATKKKRALQAFEHRVDQCFRCFASDASTSKPITFQVELVTTGKPDIRRPGATGGAAQYGPGGASYPQPEI